MKYVTRLMIAFLFCLSIPLVMPGSQSLPDLLKGSGLLILKDNSKGLVEGNVCLDAAGTGTFSDESAIPSLANSGTIGADDMAAYLADRLDSATVGFRTKCVAALFGYSDKTLTASNRESLGHAVNLAGADLSAGGIHPLAKRKIYFVPDGSGNFVKDPQAVMLYDSGKIMELNVSYGKSYKLRIPDGRTVDVGHAGYHENGMVFFVSTDSISTSSRIPMQYAGTELPAFSVSWDPEGKIGGLGFNKGNIVLKLPDGTETTEADSFSYLTKNKKPGVWMNNETLIHISFRYNNAATVKLPDGQTLDGNISLVSFYDNGNIKTVSVYPNGKPIRWKLPKTQPVGFGEKWEKKIYWERITHVIPTEKIFPAGTVIEARGGLQFTPEGELISYWGRE